MTCFGNQALGSGARVGREILRNDHLLHFLGGAMKSDRGHDSLLDEPAGDTISDFHQAASISLRGQSAEEMQIRHFGSRSTSGDA